MARCLGWFSIALGAVELVAPRAVARFFGMRDRDHLVRMFGAREISAGIVSLSTEKLLGAWSRVAGNGMDLAALIGAYRADNPKRSHVGSAIGIIIGVAALGIAASQMMTSVHARKPSEWRRYSDRSGFPRGLHQARGVARASDRGSQTKDSPRTALG